MNPTLRLAATCALLCLPQSLSLYANAAEPPAHVHGVATLEVAIDGAAVEIRLDTPLANLLGFEHKPTTPAELEKVRMMRRELDKAAALFVLPTQAGCTAGPASIESPSLDLPVGTASNSRKAEVKKAGPTGNSRSQAHAQGHGENKRKQAADKDHDHEHEGHADLEASYRFDCRQPAVLNYLDVGLFHIFPGIVKINVQSVGPRGQAARQLDKNTTRLTW